MASQGSLRTTSRTWMPKKPNKPLTERQRRAVACKKAKRDSRQSWALFKEAVECGGKKKS